MLSICHEAYEEYLASNLQINLATFFTDKLMAIPIIHSEISFLQPLLCGDRILVFLTPQLINDKVLETHYQIYKDQEIVGNALIRHICINPQTRKTQPLPDIFKIINH